MKIGEEKQARSRVEKALRGIDVKVIIDAVILVTINRERPRRHVRCFSHDLLLTYEEWKLPSVEVPIFKTQLLAKWRNYYLAKKFIDRRLRTPSRRINIFLKTRWVLKTRSNFRTDSEIRLLLNGSILKWQVKESYSLKQQMVEIKHSNCCPYTDNDKNVFSTPIMRWRY